MSYILDALRKADAQRARDPARGIHAQPTVVPVAGDPGVAGRGRWMAATAALLIVLAAGWMWLTPAPVAAPPAVGSAAPAPVARMEPAAIPMPLSPANEVLPPAPAAAPEPVAVAAPKPTPVAAASAAAASASAAATPAAAPAVAAPAADRTYSLAELPPDVQQALPKFSVSGGVYSENVAQRMLVVNGQVFNEGSEIATGVVLEQIRPRVALLKFRGLRIAQPY